MKITYISHSGFLIETKKKYLLFDYYKGEIPVMEEDKPLYVFASHAHPDHFHPSIFGLEEKHPEIKFFLAYDIKLKTQNMEKWGITEAMRKNIVSTRANETYKVDDIRVTTYKSTDAGVAFLVETEGRTLYHAGDLNWWYWEGESKQWNNNMTASFQREIEKMTEVSVDLAFLPLDPRQGQYYYLGFEYLLKKVKVKYAVPMHMWDDFSVIGKLKKDRYPDGCDTNVIEITREGEVFELWENQ